MNLPNNLQVVPGVRTDHLGRAYQYGRYPSGKMVPIPTKLVTNEEPGYTVPVVEPKVTIKRKGPAVTRNSKGEVIPVVYKPQRKAVLECRKNGAKELERWEFDSIGLLNVNLKSMLPKMDLKEDGSILKQHEPTLYDWHVCYHIDKERA